MIKDLAYYQKCFSSLKTMKNGDYPAPHKALLLLSIVDLIEKEIIVSPQIELNNNLINRFKHNTSNLLPSNGKFKPVINYPYYHMKSEPFWQLVANTNCQIDKICNYSLPNLRANIAYAKIDDELFSLLHGSIERDSLRSILRNKYIDYQAQITNNETRTLYSNNTFEERLDSFKFFIDTYHRFPLSNSGERESSLYRWYCNIYNNLCKISLNQKQAFLDLIGLYEQMGYPKTQNEINFLNNCEKIKAYIKEFYSLPTISRNRNLYLWLKRVKKYANSYTDQRRIYLSELLQYISSYGFEI